MSNPYLGEIRLFGLEGDRQLGVPPEQFTGCPTCWDFVSFKSNTAGAATVRRRTSLSPGVGSPTSTTRTWSSKTTSTPACPTSW